MADLKTVLTETLAAHEGPIFADGMGHFECMCGWNCADGEHSGGELWATKNWAAHVAGVLLGLSGVAVTQLPKADPDNDPTLYDASFKVASDDEYMTGARTPRVCIDATTRELYTVCTPSAHISPAEARSYAAALLAAAGVFSEGATNE